MKSNYRAREMKTVYVECSCQFLKICFSKNYQNSKNIFNQIGLVSLQVFGSLFSSYEAALLGQTVAFDDNQNDLSQDMIPRNMKIEYGPIDNLDPVLREKILLIEDEKRRAVEVEDYEKAKQMKMLVDKLKVLAN